MSEHSLFSPSSAHRWLVCTASLERCKGIPESTSEHAEEGTRAHALAAVKLNGGTVGSEEIPQEMQDATDTYVANLKRISTGAVETFVEVKVDLLRVLGVVGAVGTADFIAVLPTELQVHDLKYGKGVAVKAEGNWQMILYALGALQHLDDLAADCIEQIRMVIHQPRIQEEPEEWTIPIKELLCYRTGIQERMKVILNGYTKYVPGEKQCRWCPAKGECEALAKFSTDNVLEDFEDVSTAIAAIPTLTPEKVVSIYSNLELITEWVKAFKEHLMSQMLQGKKFPGLKLVAGRAGNRQWSDEKAVEEVMKSMRLRIEEMYNLKLISPTDAEKLLKDHKRKWNRVSTLVTRSEPKPAIVPVNDKRPELVVSATVEDFSDEDSLE